MFAANSAIHAFLAAYMRFDSRAFAFSNSARWEALSPLPARLMKYVSIRKPEVGPFGDTLVDASVFAIVEAFFVIALPAGASSRS